MKKNHKDIIVLLLCIIMIGCTSITHPRIQKTNEDINHSTDTLTLSTTRSITPRPTVLATLPIQPNPTEIILPAITQTIFPSLIDNFNSHDICPLWNVNTTPESKVFQREGRLHIEIPLGKPMNSNNQLAGVSTRNYVLHGNFDISVEFHFRREYYSTPGTNTKIFLIDKNDNAVGIGIQDGEYITGEQPPVGAGEIHNEEATKQVDGKLRIARNQNHITTYYWDSGWMLLGDWEAEYIRGDLLIDMDSWNWPPYYSSFESAFDNLYSAENLDVNCK